MKIKVFKEKIAPVLGIVVAIAVIVLSTLGLVGVIEDTLYITTPLLGVMLLLQSFSHWGRNKGVAIFSLSAGIFVLICTVVILILQ